MCGFGAHDASARRTKRLLPAPDLVGADRLLERKARPARIDSTIAGVPPSSRRPDPGGSAVPRADEEDRPAARHDRHAVREEPPLRDEHAGRPGAAGELVRREEDRVLVGKAAVGHVRRRVHVDRQVRAGRGVVPERERAMAVQQDRDRVDVRDDAGHVRRGREGADRRAGRCAWRSSSCLEVAEVEPPVGALADRRRRPPSTPARAARSSGARTGRRSTTGRSVRAQRSSAERRGRACRSPPVAPEPQKSTTSSSAPPTAPWMMRRASSRNAVVCSAPSRRPPCACSRRGAAPRRG